MVVGGQRVGLHGRRHHRHHRGGRGQPGPPAPARRGQPPGGGEQQHEPGAGQPHDHRRIGESDQQRSGRQRPRPDQQPVLHVRLDEDVGGQPEADAQQQPAHRVPGPAAGQERAHGRRAHGGQDDRHDDRAQTLGAGAVGGGHEPGQPGPGRQAQHGQAGQRGRPPASSHAAPPRCVPGLAVWPVSVPGSLRPTRRAGGGSGGSGHWWSCRGPGRRRRPGPARPRCGWPGPCPAPRPTGQRS